MSTDAIDGVPETTEIPAPAKTPAKKKPVKKSAPVKKTAPKAATKPAPKATPKAKAGRSPVTLKQAQLAALTLKMASDATRLQVIAILSDGECHVGGLSINLNQSQPAVSHHLALLRHSGIIVPRRDGKNNFYSLTERGTELARVVKLLMSE